ncbi:MAG: ABC transporter ATP-binding protein [Acidimicrobiia bacterium]|nr:ABC transporter ATP-binding protein [Acidimicrobiia bacterium]
MSDVPMLQMRGITKRFPGVLANYQVDFDVRSGEVHTLLGENGAGKSTLMKILYGLYEADEGEILLNGERVEIHSPDDAIARNIGMIHQHFMLVETLTVAENVALGLPSDRGIRTDLDAVSQRIEELAERYGLAIDPSAIVWQLAVGQRQRVEIIKALYRDAHLLILDEPTAVLTPQEVDQLFVTLRQMTKDGRGLIFISHKLHEVLALSDRITVLRQGHITGQVPVEGATRESLAEMMVGRQVKLAPDKPPVEVGKPALEIRGLRVSGDRGDMAVNGLNLEVRAGEIVGIAGVSGNGQREMCQAIAGLRQAEGGSIHIGGVETTNLKPAAVRKHGLAYVTEGRLRDGAIADFSISENIMLIDHADPRYLNRGLMDFKAIREHSQALVDQYAVKTPTLETPARNLSGGNIQKMILAREMSGTPTVLVASQPTRGVDIGAAEYIHTRLVQQRAEDTAILMVSEDLDEVFALSDRIAVIYEGEIIGIVDPETATREQIGLMMAGVRPES